MSQRPAPIDARPAHRIVAEGPGWRMSDVICTAGPQDTPYEERHDRMAVGVVVSGSFTYRCEHGTATMTPGSILLGNQGGTFCCSHEHGVGDRCAAFHFDPDFLDEAARGLRGVRNPAFAGTRIAPSDAVAPLLAEVQALVRDRGAADAGEVAWRMASGAMRLDGGGELAPPSPRDAARVLEVVRFIEGNLADPLGLQDFAALAGLSRFHFLRVFSQVVGVTPYKYVLARRLSRAATLLRTTDESVLAVSLDCGFGDLSEFTRRFTSKFGRSPGAFRKSAGLAPQ